MTPRQKRIIGGLALANGVFLAILAATLLRGPVWLTTEMPTAMPRLELTIRDTVTSADAGAIRTTRSPATDIENSDKTMPPAGSMQDQCLWEATQRLAAADLSATVHVRADETLWFQITFPLTNSQPFTDAAQAAWAAFDVTLALQENDDCPPFDHISVNINAESSIETTPIIVETETTALLAFSTGNLDEEGFIDLVRYVVLPAAQQTPEPQQTPAARQYNQ